MSNIIGKDRDYDGKSSSHSNRPIKTKVSLFGKKQDSFSHSAPVRHTHIEGMPKTYENIRGGHREERE